MRSSSLETPSKINLYLRVAGRRADGYHEIETFFFPLSTPSDTITVSETDIPGISIRTDHPDVPCNSSNLCWKTASAFAEASGIAPAWNIDIKKNIPVAGGMGGGSSDGAAVLRILSKLYGHPLSDYKLAEIALKAGADLPFFLNPLPSKAEGVGEKLSVLDCEYSCPPILIAVASFPVSAAWSYKNRIEQSPEKVSIAFDDIFSAYKARDWQACGKLLRNDLAPAVMKKFPLLQMIHSDFMKSGACGAEISGSGPSLFAIYPDYKTALSARSSLETRYSGQVRFIPAFK